MNIGMNHRIRAAKLAAMAVPLVALTLAAPAQAQYGTKTVELIPFAGYYIGSDLYGYYTSIPLENSFMWGARLSVAPTPRGGIEFAYTRATSEILAPVGLSYISGHIGDLTIDSYDLNFIGYQPTGNPRVTPFASFGFGWSVVNTELGSPDINGGQPTSSGSNTLFNFNFALGTKVKMNERASLRLEGRWRTTDTNIQTGAYSWCDIYGYCYSYGTSWYSSWELIGGLAYKLGS